MRVASVLVPLLAGALMMGCADDKTVVKTVTVEREASSSFPAGSPPHPKVSHRARRSPTARPSPEFVACDPNISVLAATTSCGFAQNAFYEYWTSGEVSEIRVYSPRTRLTYDTHCSIRRAVVKCTTKDHRVVKFPVAAVARYDQTQANRYAATHDLGYRSRPGGGSSSGGDGSSAPSYGGNSEFCDSHDCIPNYGDGNGYTVRCVDGTYSHSGGIQGACSHHGGVG